MTPEQTENLTYAQAAELCNLPIGTLHSLVCKRMIPHIRLGPRSVRFVRARLLQWLTDHEVMPVGTAETSATTPGSRHTRRAR